MTSLRRFQQTGWKPRCIILASGAICVFGFAPFHVWPLPVIALTILLVRLHGVSALPNPGRVGFGTGLLFGLGWFSASCFWIASAFFERGPEFLPLVPPLVGGLAVVLSLFWAMAGYVSARIFARARFVSGCAAFVGAFMLAELARGHLFSGFPWNLAGYAFAPGGWGSQMAFWIGIYGLTMLIYFVAAGFGAAWITGRVKPALGAALVFTGLFAFGGIRLHGASVDFHPDIRLRLVSVAFRQSEKIDPATSPLITQRFIDQSFAPGIEDVTHLIWPEGAVNGIAIEDYQLLAAMGYGVSQVDDSPPVWIMNSIRSERQPDPDTGMSRPEYYNSSVAVTFDAFGNPAIAATNDKKKLVPFGEFIPGGEVVERLGARLVSTNIASLLAAPEKRLADFPGLPTLSPQICYEVIFPGLTPSGTTGRRPEFILNQSNDAWFGDTIGPAQHAAIARYRAIEEGLPLVRSTANGVTGVFDSYGRPIDQNISYAEDERAFHQDARLPKSLNINNSHKLNALILLLINLVLVLQSMMRHNTKPRVA